MLGVVEDLVERPFLDHPAGVHHQHPVGDLGDDAEVVGDQDRGQAALAVELLEQAQDLRLDRHVERGGRLVGDQHFRLQRQRHRDHRPLPHAAGEFVRVVVDPALGVGDADRVEQLDRPRPPLGLGDVAAVGADRLDDLAADPVDRVERGHRVLEDHRDPLAAHLLQLRVARVQQLRVAQLHRALDLGVGRAGEADDRLRGDALARAGLADDRQHFARGEVEADPVDRLQQAAFGREADPQVPDGEQRAGAHWAELPSRIRGSR